MLVVYQGVIINHCWPQTKRQWLTWRWILSLPHRANQSCLETECLDLVKNRDTGDSHQCIVTKFRVYHRHLLYSEHSKYHNWSEQKTKEIIDTAMNSQTDSLVPPQQEPSLMEHLAWEKHTYEWYLLSVENYQQWYHLPEMIPTYCGNYFPLHYLQCSSSNEGHLQPQNFDIQKTSPCITFCYKRQLFWAPTSRNMQP